MSSTRPKPVSATSSAATKPSPLLARADRARIGTSPSSRQRLWVATPSARCATSAMAPSCPGHQQAHRVRGGLLWSEGADDVAAVHDHQPVAHVEELIQVLGDEQ